MSPIRLLHFADAHLGIENYGRLDPSTGLNSRLLDFTRCLDQIVDRALEGDIDLVVFAGDAYRSRDPNPTHQREFARRIQRLSRAGIPTFLVVGNHDLPAATGRANSIDIFDTLGVPNVTVARTIDLHRIDTRKGPVQVLAVPWANRSKLLAKEEARTLTPDEAKHEIEDRYADTIMALTDLIDDTLPAVLVGHLTVEGASFGSERSVLVGDDFVLPRSVLCGDKIDYIALGHIHKHQIVNNRPLALYAGSIERIDFGEEREDKGYVIVDLESKGETSYRFEPVAARRFLTIEVDARGAEPMAEIERRIGDENLTDTVVRLRLATRHDREALIDLSQVRLLLRDASFVAGIIKDVEREDRPTGRDDRFGELTPEEALAAYLRAKHVSPDRVDRLLELGRELLRSRA